MARPAVIRACVLLASALLLAACTTLSPEPVPQPSTPAPTLGGTGRGVVAQDIAYADGSAGPRFAAPTLDLYLPSTGPAPLVVILHDGGFDNRAVAYPLIAQRLSALGVAVASVAWGLQSPTNAFLTAGGQREDLLGLLRQLSGQLDCAISASVSRAGDAGIAVDRITLLGHGTGANLAATGALGVTGRPFPGCLQDTADWAANALVLWDGDWLLAQTWDGWGPDLGAELVPLLTPWSRLDGPDRMPVDVVVTEQQRSASAFRTCLRDQPDFLTDRDPDGSISRWLEAVGALGDGCVSRGEASDALAAALVALGYPTSTVDLAAAGTRHSVLARPDLDALVALLAERSQ